MCFHVQTLSEQSFSHALIFRDMKIFTCRASCSRHSSNLKARMYKFVVHDAPCDFDKAQLWEANWFVESSRLLIASICPFSYQQVSHYLASCSKHDVSEEGQQQARPREKRLSSHCDSAKNVLLERRPQTSSHDAQISTSSKSRSGANTRGIAHLVALFSTASPWCCPAEVRRQQQGCMVGTASRDRNQRLSSRYAALEA